MTTAPKALPTDRSGALVVRLAWPTIIATADYPEAQSIKESLAATIKECVGPPTYVGERNTPKKINVGDRVPDGLWSFLLRSASELASTLMRRPVRVVREHFTKFWGNVHAAGEFYQPHTHETLTTAFVGTYYVQVPRMNSPYEGRLCLLDPRKQLSGSEMYEKLHHFGDQRFTPVEGRLVLFPPHLIHYIYPHTADTERIGLTFHVGIDAVERGAE